MITKYKDKRISTIIRLEVELTEALINGHKAADNDRFAKTRAKLRKLREQLNIT